MGLTPLRWKGNDAFDAEGRRMATVTKWDYTIPTGNGTVSKAFWQAHVANELVWVDGSERFEGRKSAKAAAESAYRDRVLASGDPAAVAGPRSDVEPDWNAPPRRAEPARPVGDGRRTTDPVSRAPGLLGTFVDSLLRR
jgi:hypothetical protein